MEPDGRHINVESNHCWVLLPVHVHVVEVLWTLDDSLAVFNNEFAPQFDREIDRNLN